MSGTVTFKSSLNQVKTFPTLWSTASALSHKIHRKHLHGTAWELGLAAPSSHPLIPMTLVLWESTKELSKQWTAIILLTQVISLLTWKLMLMIQQRIGFMSMPPQISRIRIASRVVETQIHRLTLGATSLTTTSKKTSQLLNLQRIFSSPLPTMTSSLKSKVTSNIATTKPAILWAPSSHRTLLAVIQLKLSLLWARPTLRVELPLLAARTKRTRTGTRMRCCRCL